MKIVIRDEITIIYFQIRAKLMTKLQWRHLPNGLELCDVENHRENSKLYGVIATDFGDFKLK